MILQNIYPFIFILLIIFFSINNVYSQFDSTLNDDEAFLLHEGKNLKSDDTLQSLSMYTTWLEPWKERYHKLSPKGKFLTSAFAGYMSSKVGVKPTIQAFKVTSAIYITSEAIHSTGILSQTKINSSPLTIPQQTRNMICRAFHTYHVVIRKYVSLNMLKSSIYRTTRNIGRVGVLGFSTGALTAFFSR